MVTAPAEDAEPWLGSNAAPVAAHTAYPGWHTPVRYKIIRPATVALMVAGALTLGAAIATSLAGEAEASSA
jgi:hypothetical protein